MPKADQSDRLHWPLVLLNGEEGVEGRHHSKVTNHKVTGTTRQEKKGAKIQPLKRGKGR